MKIEAPKVEASGRANLGAKKRRTDRERGSALVEAAFITPLLLMLLLGTVTSALAYSQSTSLQTASREGSRFGASLPVNGNLTQWLTDVMVVAKAAGNLDLQAATPGQSICVAYVYPNGTTANDRTTKLVQTGGVTGGATLSACFNDGRPNDERRVQVVTGRTATIQAVLFSVNVNLSSPSTSRFER